MNDRMKQRLVGAVVLVSLAVIFIPMLLDGGEQEGMPLFGSNIPDKPEYRFEPLDIPLEPVEPVSEEKPRLVEKPEPVPQAESEPEVQPEGQPKATQQPVSPPAVQEQSEPEPVAESKTKAGQGEVAWVVQVGSFSSPENALSLRDKLRSNGFTAFMEKLKTDKGTVYRVRIGPELRRESAEAQLKRLQREMDIKGIVMGHSS